MIEMRLAHHPLSTSVRDEPLSPGRAGGAPKKETEDVLELLHDSSPWHKPAPAHYKMHVSRVRADPMEAPSSAPANVVASKDQHFPNPLVECHFRGIRTCVVVLGAGVVGRSIPLSSDRVAPRMRRAPRAVSM